jgi:predicted CXXCH cytochrome family protein
MSSHVWRPVLVVIALVVLLFIFRQWYVPDDFGVHANGFSYGWYRQSSLLDWRWLPTKYQGRDTCSTCHQKEYDDLHGMPHVVIQCENCHGPATDHPKDPEKLPIDRSRGLCLRCHAKLAYPSTSRGGLRGIDPARHHPGEQCASCHNPHKPLLTGLATPGPHDRHDNSTCRPCHQDQVDVIQGMPHEIVYCESCHGYAGNHPTRPAKLTIDTRRTLCLKCHVSKRDHNAGRPCVTCHDPHKSSLQFLRFQP